MKIAEALDEAKLAQLLLQLAPQAQQDQYQLIKGKDDWKNGRSSSQETREIGRETCGRKGKEESLF